MLAVHTPAKSIKRIQAAFMRAHYTVISKIGYFRALAYPGVKPPACLGLKLDLN